MTPGRGEGAGHHAAAFSVELTFHGDLGFFLRPARPAGAVRRVLKERTSVKDIIEACGVPHPEVDLIFCNDAFLDFSHVLDKNNALDIYPVGFSKDISESEHLQIRDINRFVADVHLGQLARHLRLLGIDILAPRECGDRQLLALMEQENRALLTRDRRLLMHSVVRHGFYPRSQNPGDQTLEVLRRFNLASRLAPFTRCLQCNDLLEPADRADVWDQLEPLTRKYYHEFRRCRGCGRVYWRGSHFDKLVRRVEGFRGQLPANEPGRTSPHA